MLENVESQSVLFQPGAFVKAKKSEKAKESNGGEYFRSIYWRDPKRLVVDRELKNLILHALHIHAQGSKRDEDCSIGLEIKLKEGLSTREFAAQLGITEPNASQIFHRDYEALRNIFGQTLHLTLEDLI